MRFARMRRTPAAGALATGLALTLSLAACGGGGESKNDKGLEKTDLTVGVMPITEGAGVQIAIDKGYFKQEGLNVRIRTIRGAAEGMPLLQGGSLDISQGGHVGVIKAQASGLLHLKIVAEASSMSKALNGVLVPKDSPIKSPTDLAGKKIGTNARGDQNSLLLRATLAPYKVTIDEDKSVIVAPFPNQEQLLKSGKVDAIAVPEPFVTQVQKDLGARLLTDFAQGPTKDFPITGFDCTEAFAKKNPKTVAAFQRAFRKAQADAGNRAILASAMGHFTKLDPQLVQVISMNGFPTSTNAVRLQRVADVMKEFGYLKQPFAVNTMVLENS
ncbi:ABC transporter substrate-binding protein [Spirillospora sp. NPDC049652]